MPDPDLFAAERFTMVEQQLRARGIRDPRVLEAMGSVPRHLFVPPELISLAYLDHPLSIGFGQTISQPFMVAAMSEALELRGRERVLEVGAGSGYQAAILARITDQVVAVELEPRLAQAAARRLAELGFANIMLLSGDASGGYPEQAPYDCIVVSAAARSVPEPMLEQLKEGGRLLIPVGPAENQELLRFRRNGQRWDRQTLHECRFVPLLGRLGQQERRAS